MQKEGNNLPQEKREIHNHHMDTTIWKDFTYRDDDVIIASYPKAGTTWVQQIIGQLLFDGEEGLEIWKMSPWLDIRIVPKKDKLAMLENQNHRRFIKTHTPIDVIAFSPEAKYIYVARDGRDIVWSLYNHHSNSNQNWYKALNETPGLVGDPIKPPPESIRQYFTEWLENDGYPLWPFWENVKSWWDKRDLPNLSLHHYNRLKEDLPGEIERIAGFLGIDIDPSHREQILEHCSFDYMKHNAENVAPLGGAFWDGGAKTFIYKGENKRWENILSDRDIQRYEQTAENRLGKDCAHWLATGMV